MQKPTRRRMIWSLFAAAGALSVGSCTKAAPTFDIDLTRDAGAHALGAAALIRNIYVHSDSSKAFEVDGPTLRRLGQALNGKRVKAWSGNRNSRYFLVTSGTVGGQPVLALHELGSNIRAGSAKPAHSQLKPDDIYATLEGKARSARTGLKRQVLASYTRT